MSNAMHGKLGQLSSGKASSHGTALPSSGPGKQENKKIRWHEITFMSNAMHGQFGLLFSGKASSHSTALPSFFSPVCSVFIYSLQPAVRPTLLRQTDMGPLACVQIRVAYRVHTKGSQAQRSRKNCPSPCLTRGSNPGFESRRSNHSARSSHIYNSI